ncbi:hypothetical protein L6452_11696 [Arctium lappa]|uniref:Uncharacterized protein n=1 Tax=Arctium lappa TaxID=4217 RepID=A0ACB9DQ29_ARCLA|nr:hypothetical protein L6452_11696 [Arctium lappa]
MYEIPKSIDFGNPLTLLSKPRNIFFGSIYSLKYRQKSKHLPSSLLFKETRYILVRKVQFSCFRLGFRLIQDSKIFMIDNCNDRHHQ